ncbi:MAG: hypothetical protein Ct9H300mP19_15680 [Dehalococcoidia bacterium]|nr:MAG: hypothetical protein Ct9H300mP19_15680 [Dehalococcoidia bacterium]
MLVVAQIEDKKAWDNLNDILAVPGLTGVTGGHTISPNHSVTLVNPIILIVLPPHLMWRHEQEPQVKLPGVI